MESTNFISVHPFNNEQISPKTRLILLVLFLAAVGLRLFFALSARENIDEPGKIRPFNDERFHLAYSEYLIKHHDFPIHNRFRDPEDPDLIETYWIFNEAEYAQPPLFYILNAPFAMSRNPIAYCRLFAVFLSSTLVVLGVSCAVTVFRDKNASALIAMGFLGFHPVLVRIGSSISNDNLSWLISMMLFRLYLSKNLLEVRWKCGLLIALGILTRVSFVIWLVFLLLKIIIDASRIRSLKSLRHGVKEYGFIILISFLFSGGWLIRNQMIYSDWTGLRALGWRSYVYTGSLYSLDSLMVSTLRFSFFPIAEEPGWSPLLVEAFFALIILSLIFQRNERKAEFENPEVFRDFMLFNGVNLFTFFLINLQLDYPESRHLLIGLLPLLSVAIPSFLINFKRAAAAVAITFNLICLFAFL